MLPLQNVVLLLASLFFYAWGEPVYVVLLLSSALIAWLGGLWMYRCADLGRNRAEKWTMAVVITLLVGSLGVFKYLGFLVDNLNAIPSINIPATDLRLPIGISFFSFQILSYIIDLHRGTVQVQRNPFHLLLYVSLFPQLIAGPIVRYQTVEQELTSRSFNSKDVYEGTLRFIGGLAKKILLADNVARFSDHVYDIYAKSLSDPVFTYDSVGTTALWVAALAYTLQIYFDFSGYSDMAIGLGRIFGFHFLENFNYPYVSRSITEFWRRWHISLSGWFRDYVYIPLGGNRRGLSRQIFNILVVWMLTGLWHGAAWNFVLWGLYYGVLLIIEKLAKKHLQHISINGWLRLIVTFVIVNLGWVLFHITDFGTLADVLRRMLWWHDTEWLRLMATHSDVMLGLPYIPLALLFCFPFMANVMRGESWRVQVVRCATSLALLALCFVFIMSSSFHPFIYFRF